MTIRHPPAEEGMTLEDVDTPALILDLDIFENNRKNLKNILAGYDVRIRPHAKSHKCPDIAKLQVADGAVGICCQKISEGEVMAEHGITDILISNEIVGIKKIQRLAKLSKKCKLSVCVDNLENVREIAREVMSCKSSLGIYIELNTGTDRCGLTDQGEILDIAKFVEQCRFLKFCGLQAYQGHTQHIRDYNKRVDLTKQATRTVTQVVNLLSNNKIRCPVISGGGTGTFELEAKSGVYNEIQLGSYIFMDRDYSLNLDQNGYTVKDFQQSLFILATIMSKPNSTRAVVDVGLKSVAVDSGLPAVVEFGATYDSASDEHGKLSVSEPNKFLLGDKIMLAPGHCDPTVNLHDWIIAYRGKTVSNVWEVAARGAFF